MLFCENFGGRHQRPLPAILHCLQQREGGNDGLAAADIALQQTLHRIFFSHVGGKLVPDALLGSGQLKRQLTEQLHTQFSTTGQARRTACTTRRIRSAQRQLLRQ